MYESVMKMADDMAQELSQQRRDFHKYPELGFCEMRTSSIIARVLTNLGYDEVLVGKDVCDDESRMGLPSEEMLIENYERAKNEGADPEFLPYTKGGFTGVVGILHCGEGPTVALRFDIDALPIVEEKSEEHFPTKLGFRSVNEGVMHACGHDGHTTVGLGTAKVLIANRDKLHGTVKLIFQPSEEGVRGAKAIVEKGHLDGVDYVLGAHMSGNMDTVLPMIGIGDGTSLATTKYDVIYRGKASHAGGSPELGKNAMLAAATAVLELNAIPRHGGSATRVNVGKLTAGSGRNVICDYAKLEMEVRGYTKETNEYMCNYAERIIKAAGLMHDCETEIKLMGAAECSKNTPELNERVYRVMNDIGMPAVMLPPSGIGGSEDYSYMSERVQEQGGQSCYFMNLSQVHGSFHNYKFDFDEAALVNGVKAFSAVVLDLLK